MLISSRAREAEWFHNDEGGAKKEWKPSINNNPFKRE